MKLPFSYAVRFAAALLAVFAIAIMVYTSFMARSRDVETYDDLHYSLSSVRVSVVKLEYLLDMYVVAGRSEATTIDLIKNDVEKIDDEFNAVIKNNAFNDIMTDNNPLSDGFASMIDDWQATKEEIMRLNPGMAQEGVMLLHNSVDMKTVLVTEKADRLLSVIVESRKKAFAGAKGLAFETVAGFMAFMLVLSVLFHKGVVSRIKRHEAVAKSIAEGDRALRFKADRGSKTGALGEELNRMLDALSQARSAGEEDVKRLSAELERDKAMVLALTSLMHTAGASLSQAEVFQAAVNEAVSSGGADAAAVYMGEDGALRMKASAGFDELFVREGSMIPNSELGGLEKNNTVIRFKTVEQHPSARFAAVLKAHGYHSLASAPLTYDKQTIGFLYAAFRQGGITDSSALFIEALSSGAGVSSGHINLFQREFNTRRFLERVFNQMPFGLAIFDKAGACFMSNNPLKKLLGLDPGAQAAGRYRIFEDEVFSSNEATSALRKSYEGYSTEFTVQCSTASVLRHGINGSRLKVRTFPLYDSTGEISHMAMVCEAAAGAAETVIGRANG